MKNRQGKALTTPDRLIIKRRLAEKCLLNNFAAIRLRALVCLTWGSGLRLSESTALTVSQIIEGAGSRRWRIVSRGLLLSPQAKRSRARRFYVPREARAALRAYLITARKKGLLDIPGAPDQALFVATKLPHKGGRVSVRTIELQWQELQRSCGITEAYRWHDLRHEAATAFARKATNPFQVRDFLGVKSLATAGIYVHPPDDDILEIAELARLER